MNHRLAGIQTHCPGEHCFTWKNLRTDLWEEADWGNTHQSLPHRVKLTPGQLFSLLNIISKLITLNSLPGFTQAKSSSFLHWAPTNFTQAMEDHTIYRAPQWGKERENKCVYSPVSSRFETFHLAGGSFKQEGKQLKICSGSTQNWPDSLGLSLPQYTIKAESPSLTT